MWHFNTAVLPFQLSNENKTNGTTNATVKIVSQNVLQYAFTYLPLQCFNIISSATEWSPGL